MTKQSFAVIAVIGIAACNQRTPVLDRDVLVTAPSYAQVPPVPSVSSLTVQLSAGAVWTGATTSGSVVLDSPADGRSLLTISATSGAIDVSPAQLIVPAGTRLVNFNVAARSVPSDTNVTIVASMNTVAASTSLAVWTFLPTSFSYVSDATARIDPGGFARFTPQNATIEAYCHGSQILGWVVPPPGSPFAYWAFTFGAPDGQPLRAGAHQGSSTDSKGTKLSVVRIQEPTVFCNAQGRFTVREIELAPAPSQEVRRFWVTFEQTCQGSAGVLRGDLRLTGVRPLADATPSSCFR
jgi:hypothetical protein